MLKTITTISLYTGMALAVLIAVYSLRYLLDGADAVDALSQTDALLTYFLGQGSTFWHDFSVSQKPLYHLNEFAVVGHVGTASIALLSGMLQFVPLIRTEIPLLHRASGYLYAFTVTVAFALGAYISFTLPMVGGTKIIVFNVIGSALGISFVAISFVCIWRKQYLKHGHWMLRSYAILMTILTVYLLIGVFSSLGFDPEQGYGLAHMVCFPLNLFIAELIIRKSGPKFLGTTQKL